MSDVVLASMVAGLSALFGSLLGVLHQRWTTRTLIEAEDRRWALKVGDELNRHRTSKAWEASVEWVRDSLERIANYYGMLAELTDSYEHDEDGPPDELLLRWGREFQSLHIAMESAWLFCSHADAENLRNLLLVLSSATIGDVEEYPRKAERLRQQYGPLRQMARELHRIGRALVTGAAVPTHDA